MSALVPRKVVVEYADGSARTIDCSGLQPEVNRELMQALAGAVEDASGAAGSYVVLSWEDGWQEVVKLGSEMAQLVRYFVIRRIEDRGRLSFDTGGEWPELLVLERTPDELCGALVVSDERVDQYRFGEALERYEGTFEAGGKKEFVKFDRTNDRAPRKCEDGSEALSAMVKAVQQRLMEMGREPESISLEPVERRLKTYAELADVLGLVGHARQADVYNFVEMLLLRASIADGLRNDGKAM